MDERKRGSLAVASIVAALLLALVGCSSTDGADPIGSTSIPTTTSSTTTVDPSSALTSDAVAAYEAMWQSMVAVAATGDYQSPLLAEHADGDALRVLVEGVYEAQRDGIVAKGTVETNPRVTSTGATEVSIEDCLDGRTWLQYRTTGELVDDEPGGLRLTTAEVTNTDGTWKVTRLLVGGIGTC